MRQDDPTAFFQQLLFVGLCAVVLLGAVLALLIYLMLHFRKEEGRKRALENQRHLLENQKRVLEQQAEEQRALASRLSKLLGDSTLAASELLKLAEGAETFIQLAEWEFQEGAFAPFWDAVEKAAYRLAKFEATTQQLIENAKWYSRQAPGLATPPPSFQFGLQTLPDASHTADRLQSVVRRAQKNFQFATIYEQRKTNQLLVAGFSTLGEAINDLGRRLESSLDRLAFSVNLSIADLTSVQERIASRLSSKLEASEEQAAVDAKARREHEREEREMLDNIQRRRKP